MRAKIAKYFWLKLLILVSISSNAVGMLGNMIIDLYPTTINFEMVDCGTDLFEYPW